VRVSVPKAVGRYVMHPHMPEFLRRYPKVDVQLILEDRLCRPDRRQRRPEHSHHRRARRRGLVGRQLLPIEHLLCADAAVSGRAGGAAASPRTCLRAQLHCIWVKPRPMRAGSFSQAEQGGDRRRARALCGQPHRGAAGCGIAGYRYCQPAVFHCPAGAGRREG
jgi:DNA-binding transcriptional LysR family regulator